METQNLEWLIFNALHGDVNGDIPEYLQVVIKAEQELHALLARHNALVKAVKKEHAAFDSLDGAGFQLGPVGSSIWTDHAAARAEVDRLLSGDK